MAKGNATINSRVRVAPPQLRSLRSRKRECPSDEIAETDDVQAALHHQDTERNNPAVDAVPLQCHQPPLQESTVISAQQHQAAEQFSLTKKDPAVEEKHAEATNLYLKNETVKAFEGQEETTATNPNRDSQLEGFRAHSDNDANENKKEITAEDCNRPPSHHLRSNQLQVFLPTSEEGDGSCADALDEELGENENSQSNLERNQETSQEERSNVIIADVKEIPKEAAAVLPAIKKRRMGMCGLTEKERSHFLQPQQRKNGPERVEKQICNNPADLVAQEDILSSPPSPSIPVGSVTEQNEEEIKLQSSHCEGDDRAETEVHIAVTTSDGTVCDPGCSKEKRCEYEGGVVSETTSDTKSDPPAEEEEEELLGNQDQPEREGSTAEIMPENPMEQMKDGEDGSEVVDQSPAITFHSNPTPNEETGNQDASEAAFPQVNSVSKTRDEKMEELTGDAGDGDGDEAAGSSTDNCGSVELCETVVTPSGSERKDSRDPDDDPRSGPSTVNAEHPQTRDTTDPFGSQYLDYVSDSQLNTIALTEEELMERKEDLVCSDGHEDATDLICGLIGELSSLNRIVMATQRELENLRRGSKSSRSSVR